MKLLFQRIEIIVGDVLVQLIVPTVLDVDIVVGIFVTIVGLVKAVVKEWIIFTIDLQITQAKKTMMIIHGFGLF